MNNMRVTVDGDKTRKMNGEEILYTLIDQINVEELKRLGRYIDEIKGLKKVSRQNARYLLVHGILEAYRFTKRENIKALMKRYQKKYMSGSAPMPSEEMLCVTLVNKALFQVI